MKKSFLVLAALFFAQFASARSPAPDYKEINNLAKVVVKKEFGMTCLAIGCPPAPVFHKLQFQILDRQSLIHTVYTHIQLNQPTSDKEVIFHVGGKDIKEGDEVILKALVRSTGGSIAILQKVHEITFLPSQTSFFSGSEILGCEQISNPDISFLLINNNGNLQVWHKSASDSAHSALNGKTVEPGYSLEYSLVHFTPADVKVDWSMEDDCYKIGETPNYTFTKFNGSSKVFMRSHPHIMVNQATFCSIPRFAQSPSEELECTKL